MKEINLTPAHLQCSHGPCPGIWEVITPDAVRCPSGDCPGIEQKNTMLKIIGFANEDGTGEEITCYLPLAYFADVPRESK